ncbi:MAG: biotin transporter BioY [Candidatus Eremiobacteraeota bacterium]|nr:biotin transporter BioY [Candidatus Eremiobacteraeota bacterium]
MHNARAYSAGAELWLRIALVLAGSLLMYAGAKFSIEIGPVPITGQTLALPIVVALLGTRLGLAAVVAYLAEGALGLPVFARGGGPGYLIGPTAGYLWSMPFAAVAIGVAFDRGWGRDPLRRFVAIFAGTALVIAAGALWLAAFTGSARAAFAMGVVPFLIGDLAKCAIASAVPPQGLARLAARFRL